MAIELKVPEVGESITEGMISEWVVGEGDFVAQDDTVVVIETDKVDVDVPAPASGVLKKILKKDGENVQVGEVIGEIEPGEGSKDDADEKPKDAKPKDAKPKDEKPKDEEKAADRKKDESDDGEPRVMPAARRALADAGLDAADVEATGPGGRLLKEDVERHVKEHGGKGEGGKKERGKKSEDEREKDAPKAASPSVPPSAPPPAGARQEEAVKLTPLRKRVAERLVEAQHNAAMLTTFNEIDMSRVIALRKQYQDAFTKKYGIKLGFMSFFAKAAIEALKEIPGVNAELRGDEIIYRNYYDVGIAVGGGRGLVVPVIRNAERLSFAETEKTIADLGQRARDNKLKLEELEGGTFTLSNGGIYGSLLSTPILNPPQSGILGMHKIEERPIALDGEVVIRPMMYVALTYDHRIVDGREAVTFLVRLKEGIEDPTRILLEV